MGKNAQKIAFVLLLLFIAGTAVVFSLTDEEERLVVRRGYMDGWTAASNVNEATRKSATQKSSRMSSAVNRQPSAERNAYRNGWSQGWDDKKEGNEHRYW
jgi:hypothetical protein